MSLKLSFLEISWMDILDILMVTFLIYSLFGFMKGKTGVRIFLAFLSLYLFYLISSALNMKLLTKILEQLSGVGLVSLLILFQKEIRSFLLSLGRGTGSNNSLYVLLKNLLSKPSPQNLPQISNIVDALFQLSKDKIGALIVLCREDIGLHVGRGVQLDALVSTSLLLSIFQKDSPLHDGAVIVYNSRIISAGSILPVSDSTRIPREFGTRHRAALGITEQTDSLSLVASEENGKISLARTGEIIKDFDKNQLTEFLINYLQRT
ncbi:MAG: diadenylate cyclase CdaA [Cytophagales bacterium]|nr:diadenylate cyclase CdaA [Cytophagales bacterium]